MVCWKGKIRPEQVISQPACNTDMVPTLGAIAGFADTLAHFPVDGIDISQVLFDQQTLERDIFWCYYEEQSAFRRGEWKLMNGHELYNLTADISEKNNLANEYPDKLKELKMAFEAMDSTILMQR
jgi:arylsulfatase A-like enzyme